MINWWIKKDQCCGCLACINACSAHALTICQDKEGFYFPKLKDKACTDCDLCSKACPIHNKINFNKKNNTEVECYAAYNKDIDLLKQSSSGGIFCLLANEIFKQNGVVFLLILTITIMLYIKKQKTEMTLKINLNLNTYKAILDIPTKKLVNI